MDTSLFLGILIGLGVGGWVSHMLTARWYAALTAELLENVGVKPEALQAAFNSIVKENNTESEDDRLRIPVKIEKHNEQLYAFRLDNDAFLGQGKDREELLTRITESNRNASFIMSVSEEDGAEYISEKPL